MWNNSRSLLLPVNGQHICQSPTWTAFYGEFVFPAAAAHRRQPVFRTQSGYWNNCSPHLGGRCQCAAHLWTLAWAVNLKIQVSKAEAHHCLRADLGFFGSSDILQCCLVIRVWICAPTHGHQCVRRHQESVLLSAHNILQPVKQRFFIFVTDHFDRRK